MSTQRFSTDGLDFPSPKPKPSDPADANYSKGWNEVVGKLGFTIVVVQLQRCPKAFEQAEFFESFGEEMQRVHLGHLDSSQYWPHIRFFFYVHGKQLSQALEFLKSGLKQHGLLDISAIGYYDATTQVWRVFHPNIGK